VSLSRYTILVAAVAGATFALAWAAMLSRSDSPVRWAAAFGAGLAALNTLAAHALVLAAAGRSANAFLRLVLGGMVGRMALMLAAVLGAVLWLGLPKLPLALSLLSYFILFLMIELTILHRTTSARPAEGR
jgi:hypothetical protein